MPNELWRKNIVIPAKAGIQTFFVIIYIEQPLDSRFRGNDRCFNIFAFLHMETDQNPNQNPIQENNTPKTSKLKKLCSSWLGGSKWLCSPE